MKARQAVPGAMAASAGLVTGAYTGGLEDVFRGNADAFGGYLYSAVLDGGTCEPCALKDGTFYPTLDAAAADGMDGFGPYPQCAGGFRCRCRLGESAG